MAVTTTTSLTTMDKLLKDVYLPRLREQFYSQTPAFSRLKKKTEKSDFKGRQAIIAAHYEWSEAVGAADEGDAMPSSSFQKIENMSVKCVSLYAAGRITGQTIDQARSEGEGAFAAALSLEMKTLRRTLMFDMARQVVDGDGTGRLARATTSVTGTALVVDSVRHLRKGMVVDVYQPGGTQEVSGIAITAVNRSTKTVTLASSQTWSANSYVYRKGSRNKEMMGLKGIIDDGTNAATFQGLARSSNTWLNANILYNPAGAGTLRGLTVRLINDLVMEADKNGYGGGYPTCLLSNHAHAQNYAELLRADRRYGPEIGTLDGGWTGIKYTGPGGEIPWFVDRMIRPNAILAPDEDALGYWENRAVGFRDEDGMTLRSTTDGTDAYEFQLVTRAQQGAHCCNGHSALVDLSE